MNIPEKERHFTTRPLHGLLSLAADFHYITTRASGRSKIRGY
ncbi:hypothetical protein [Paraburkholderia bannensis]|nr:hypothetical protein [Paraburkholderia bannensis]